MERTGNGVDCRGELCSPAPIAATAGEHSSPLQSYVIAFFYFQRWNKT